MGNTFKDMDVESVACAIEADTGKARKHGKKQVIHPVPF